MADAFDTFDDTESLPEQDSRKSSSAFRTIGEVATDLGLPPHVLRFWESKFPQIKPHKRRGGHRYYRPADIDILRTIKQLLYDKGFTIRGAQQFLREQRKADAEDVQTNLFQALPEAAPAVIQNIAPTPTPVMDAPVQQPPLRNFAASVVQSSIPVPDTTNDITPASLVDTQEIEDILHELAQVRDLLNAPTPV